MLKRSLIYLILSILVVIFANYFHRLVVYIAMLYAYVNLQLTPLFNLSGLGPQFRKVILLVLIPVIISGIPALSYRLIKGKDMPYLIESTWCIWLVVVLSIVLLHY